MTALTPVTTLMALLREGASLTVVDGRLSLKAETPIPAELVAAVKEHRDRLLEILTLAAPAGSASVDTDPEPMPTEPHHCGSIDWWQRPSRNSGGWVCGLCHPPNEVLRAEWRARKEAAA